MVRIIDTSVAIKWFVLEPGRDRALAVLAEILASPSHFAVPEIFYFELAHVFHRCLPDPSEEQLALLARVVTLGIQRFSMTPALLSEIQLVQRLGLSGYDAAFVALAKLLQGRWITCDRRAHAKVARLELSEVL